jgi:hypothetical protein
MSAPGTDDDIGRLFSVRPAEFVGERKAVVKTLKAAGRREEAAAVEKLPRPTLSVWAVNQIARREPALLRRLADATAGLQGGNAGGASRYADVLAAHREVLKALRGQAEEILNASGFRPTPDLLTRVVHDLRAGISSPESRSLIESGRLVRDVTDDGEANPFAGAPEAPPPTTQAGTQAGTHAGTDARAHERTSGLDDRAEREQERARALQAAREREAVRAREEARAFRRRRLENLRERVATARAASERDERAREAASRAVKEAERRAELSRAALAEVVAALEAAEADPEP